MSAYEIKQFIGKSVSHFWTEGEGQIYPTLRKLTEGGLVTSKEAPAMKSGIKKIYSITKKGESHLFEWLEAKSNRPIYRNELLLKLFFGNNQSAEKNLTLIENTKQECTATLETLETVRASLSNKHLSPKRLVYVEICLDYGIDSLQEEINWCSRSIQKLQTLQVK